MQYLWAPWRMEYILSKKTNSDTCIFCDKIDDDDDDDNLIVFRGKYSMILMNLYPYNNGHLMIIPYNHKEKFESLSKETQHEMMILVSKSMKILRKTLNAEGFNFGSNLGEAAGAGIKEHLHFHIVPRWIGDTNFMPVIGQTKVQVDGLKETRKKLNKAFLK